MKNLIQYLKLWQKKRDELRVDTDAGSDWLDMNALLDKHMPTNHNPGGSIPKKGISLFTTVLITLSAAAMFYVGHNVYESKKKAAYHKDTLLHNKKGGFAPGTDSLSASDSLKPTQDQSVNGDSASATQDSTATASSPDNGSNKNNDKSLVKANPANSKSTSERSNGSDKKEALNANNAASSAGLSHLANSNGNGKNSAKANKPGSELSSNSSRSLNKPGNGKKLNGNRDNRRDGTLANNQGLDLSENSSQLLNKPNNGQKLNSPGGRNNGKNNALTKAPGSNPDTFVENNNLVNDNSPYTEAHLNAPNRSQINNGGNQLLSTLPDGRSIGVNPGLVNAYATLNSKPLFQTSVSTSTKGSKSKIRSGLHINGTFDWGVLIGANSSGSFTPSNLNKNGSLPIDIFPGIYGTYNLDDKWGIGAQVSLLSPQIAKGATYDRPYFFYSDSSVTVKSKLVSSSKKIYSVQVPVYATYQVPNNIHLKAGPVISFPLKQYSIATVDSVSQEVITHSRYDQKTDFGFAGGANYQYKRLIFEVNYLKGITQHSIVTDSLIHKATNNTFQFSIKLQLGGKKK